MNPNLKPISMFTKKLLFGSLFFAIFACQPEVPEEITFTLQVENPNPKVQYAVVCDAKMVKFKLSEDTNSFTVKLPFVEPEMFNVYGDFMKSVYAEPGDDLKVIVNTNENNEKEFTYEGAASTYAQLMEQFSKIDTDFKEKNAELEHGEYSLPWEDYTKAIDEMNDKKTEAINNTEGVSEAFKNIAKAELWTQNIKAKNRFQSYYNGNIKGEDAEEMNLEEIENIYVDAFKFDTSALASVSFRSIIRRYALSYQFQKMSGDDDNEIPWYSRQDAFVPIYKALKVDDSIPTYFKEYALESFVSALIGFVGIDIADEIRKDFVNKYPGNNKVESLNAEYEKWSSLKSGEPAIDFTYENVAGKKESLSDYYGKVIYIDVWATWCAPCVSEFKSSKKLKARLADAEDVVFIYVSLDDADKKDKWKIDLEMHGLDKDVNLFAGGGFDSPLCDSYLIEGIPRYILIDKEGKIHSSKAARPSSKDLIYNEIQKLRGVDNDLSM